jgi:hypothetical protein
MTNEIRHRSPPANELMIVRLSRGFMLKASGWPAIVIAIGVVLASLF